MSSARTGPACRCGHSLPGHSDTTGQCDVIRNSAIAKSKFPKSKCAKRKFAKSKCAKRKFAKSKFAKSRFAKSKFAKSKFA